MFFKSFSRQSGSHKDNNIIISPLSGELIPLASVNDEVFSQGILGEGAAVIPDAGQLYAPADAVVLDVFDTKHAITLICDNGAELLIHIGLDTVNLEGRPFSPKATKGDHVKAGDLIMEFDINEIITSGYDPVTPIIISNYDKFTLDIHVPGKINAGEQIIKLSGNS